MISNNLIICYLYVHFFICSPEFIYLMKVVFAHIDIPITFYIINMLHFILIIFTASFFFFWVNNFNSSVGSLMGKQGFDCGWYMLHYGQVFFLI